MVDFKKPLRSISHRTRFVSGAVALLALGAAGGAGAVAMTRPAVEMAPTVPTAIARLPQANGIVTVKGKVAEIFGNRFIMQDASGRTLVDVGPRSSAQVGSGSVVMVQGRYDNGQLRASYLVDPQGQVEAVGGPPCPPPPHHRGGPGGPGRDGPPLPPPPGPDGAPPPPPPPPPGDGQPNGASGMAPPPPPPVPPVGAAVPNR